jgi:hypothetical protein
LHDTDHIVFVRVLTLAVTDTSGTRPKPMFVTNADREIGSQLLLNFDDALVACTPKRQSKHAAPLQINDSSDSEIDLDMLFE